MTRRFTLVSLVVVVMVLLQVANTFAAPPVTFQSREGSANAPQTNISWIENAMPGWNDRVESIVLPDRTCIKIYEHINYGGDSQILCNTTYDSNQYFDLTDYIRDTGANIGANWSRETSSYKVWKLSSYLF